MPKYKSQSEPKYLNEFLEQYSVPELKQLAGLIASNLPTRKAEIIQIIHIYLTKPENLRRLWQQLDETQQAAVAEVVHNTTSRAFDANRFRAKYGKDPDWGKLQYSYYYAEKGQPSRLQLFFYRFNMPLDIKEALKAFVPRPRPVQIRTGDNPPETVLQKYYEFNYDARKSIEHVLAVPVLQVETERAALQDIQAVLRLIDTGKVRASDKTKQVTAAGAKAITEILYGGDFYPPDEVIEEYDQKPIGPIKAFAWPLLLQNAGLAELAGTKLQLTGAGKKALNDTPEKTIRVAWNKWLKTNILDEFNRIHTIKGQTGRGKHSLTAVSSRRGPIAQALSECPAGEWIAFDEFSRYMQAAGHTFEVARDLWPLYIADPQYGSLGYAGFGDWHIVQGRYLLAFLFEYAATLGLIDVAYIPPVGARSDYGKLWGTDDLDCLSRYDGLLYLRLNNLGAWVLGQAEKFVPSSIQERQILKVLPNFDIVAIAPLPAGDQLFLEQFTTQTAESVWKLDRENLLKAIEGGQRVTDIQNFLQAKSGDALPSPVAALLNETAERVVSLKNQGQALLIEARDPALAQLIAHESTLRSLCLLAGERHIVIPAENETAFRRALRRLGYGISI
jgi:hypothetical protein